MNKGLLSIWQRAGNNWYILRDDFLLKRGLPVMLIQVAGLILSFGGNLLLARLYGEQVFGTYSLISSWVALLSALAMFGMDDLHVVKLPSLELQHRKQAILAQLRWSLKVNVLAISVVSILFYFLVHTFKLPGLSPYAYYVNISLLMICALTFYNNFMSCLRALDKVVRGEVTDKIIRPLVFALAIGAFFYAFTRPDLFGGKKDLLTAAIVSNALSLFVGAILLLLLIKRKVGGIRDTGGIQKEAFPIAPNLRYMALTLLYLLSIRLDILLLGTMAGAVEVGHYNVAIKFADILSYPVIIANLSLPALFSRQRHDNGGKPAPAGAFGIAKSLFFQCLVLGAILLPASTWILGWYGKGFKDAFPVLCIFFLSGLATAATGGIETFFIMEGQESKVIFGRMITIALIALLAFILIPLWGAPGAAIATLTGNLIYCGLLEFFFYREYGIFIHPFTRKKR